MSLLGKIAALFSGGGSASRVCVVDGDRMVGSDRVGPGERFQALNKLARFATREELQVKVVFGGRPLREADEGADYNGVQVFYAESAEQVQDKISKTLSSVGRGRAILVTSDAALEVKEISRGASTMRMSTLRKAMDPGFEANGGGREGGAPGGNRERDRDRDGGRRGRGRNRGRRPNQGEQRDNNGNNGSNGGDGSENRSRPAESAPAAGDNSGGNSGGGNDAVKNLIDLVE